ncbi:MAG: CoA-binding protein [Fuerstiella sp.]|nr:CoA-binding protein [Fuerstiella sp.]MCP4787422.1 CoA-binding protein [Fuerstiella sp.]MCP4856638.1 CoA-binding protein [Fuerstiella sp.]
MHLDAQIADFMHGDLFAVAGASTDRRKYGNKVLRCYQQHGHNVVPVNPNSDMVEGLAAVASLNEVRPQPHAVSIITPSAVTKQIVEEAICLGIQHLWLQPGAESFDAIKACRNADINLIHSGPCILVVLGYSER